MAYPGKRSKQVARKMGRSKRPWLSNSVKLFGTRTTARRRHRISILRGMGRGIRPIGYNRRVRNGGYGTIGSNMSRGGAKVAFIQKKYAGSVPINRKLLDALYADNTINMTYVDRVNTVETTTGAAKQAMWASRVTPDGRNGSTMLPMFNLCVHDPRLLGQTLSFGDQSTTVRKTNKVLIKNYRVRACLTNIETGPIDVWEYRLITRQRLRVTDLSTILSTLDDSDPGTSTATNVIGYTGFDVATASITAAGTSATQVNIGVTPYQIAALTKWCKISSVKKKCMQPGDRWEIEYASRKPMIYDNEKWNLAALPSLDGTVTDSGLQAGQGFSLFVMKGTYAADSNGAAGQLIGIGNAAVGIEYFHGCHFACIMSNTSRHQIIQDAAGFTAGQAGYWGPVVNVHNLNAIAVGAAAQGTDVDGPAGAGIEDYYNANDD